MNKEKQIEEMAKDFCALNMPCEECHLYKNGCHAKKYAVRAYKAGYRKASEVAREIFEELESVFYLASYTVQRPMGSLTTKTVEGIHMRNEDYHTIKKKYTQEK